MATFSVLEAFRGASPPAPWFRVLEIDPLSAASQLLFGTGNFSTYQAAEPLHLALQWLREVRDPSFAQTLDLGFSGWVEKFWGVSIPVDSAGSASLTAEAWQNLCLILTGHPVFENAAASLRERVLIERNFLLAVGEGPTSDPAGRALQAISRYQKDRTLQDYWWELVALPPGEPWFHGEYAIDGLCHLPVDGTKIPELVPSGLRRLADGLSRRAGEGWLDAKLARRHFLRIAQLTQRRFPFEEKWHGFWLGVYRSTKDENTQAWIQSLCGFSEEQRDDTGVAGRIFSPNPFWSGRGRDIASRLAIDHPNALRDADILIAEEEAYLDQTGDAQFFVLSACNFASKIKNTRPNQALEWAKRARRAEPSNPFSWTIEFNCLRRMGRTSEALALALETVDRFPENVFACTGLGEVLKAQGRLDEAEQVYRETVKRTQDVFARNGLGEVLKAQGRLDEAEQVYRETVDRFPGNVFASNGLGEVLKAQGRLDEAEQTYLKNEVRSEDLGTFGGGGGILTSAPKDDGVYLRPLEPTPAEAGIVSSALPANPMPQSRPAKNPLELAEQPALRLQPADIEILLTDFVLLRKWFPATKSIDQLRQRARALLDRMGPHLFDDAVLASERAHLLLINDINQALSFLKEADRRFPGSAKVTYARARAERLHLTILRPEFRSDPGQQALLAWKRLARVDPAFEPLQLLGLSRTLPLLRDGEELETRTRQQLGELAFRINRMAKYSTENSFERLWAGRVREAIFAGETVRSVDELGPLPPLISRLEEYSKPLDHLESQYVDARAVV